MFEFPSIMSGTGQTFQEFDARVFGKLDGRNVRVEWSKKHRFHKFGTRTARFDETDVEYGQVVPLFFDGFAEPLDNILRKERLDRAVVFLEYFGYQSLGGVLVPGDEMMLSLIAACFDGKQLLDARTYLKLFDGKVETAPYLGRYRWTRGFVAEVFQGNVDEMPLEGVIGYGTEGQLAKAKTKAWLDAVRSRYSVDVAEKIVNS